MLLQEPAELPICLLHVGSDGEVLAGLDGDLPGAVDGRLVAEPHQFDGVAETGFSQAPDGTDSAEADGPDLIEGLELADYFEGTLDPAATVRALSDAALGQLADALYRHLDTPNPSFGAHTWYELAAEELQRRYRAAECPGEGPAEDELAAGPALT